MIKNFNDFQNINESVNESVTLYRIVNLKPGEKLDVQKNIGDFYCKSKNDCEDIKGENGVLVTVKTEESNIDEAASKKESGKQGCDCIVVKNDDNVEFVSANPVK